MELVRTKVPIHTRQRMQTARLTYKVESSVKTAD